MSGNGNDLHMQTYGKNDYKLSDLCQLVVEFDER